MPADTIDPFDNVPFATTPPKNESLVEFYINGEKDKIFVGKVINIHSDVFTVQPATGYENKFPPNCPHGFMRIPRDGIIREL